MADAQERIWAWQVNENHGSWASYQDEIGPEQTPGTPYVRADIADEMLEALKGIVWRITPTMDGSVDGDYIGGAVYHGDDVIKRARAAIAKAEGTETPTGDKISG